MSDDIKLPPATVVVLTHGEEPAISICQRLIHWWSLLGKVWVISPKICPAPPIHGAQRVVKGMLNTHCGGRLGVGAQRKIREQWDIISRLPGDYFCIFEYDSFILPVGDWKRKMLDIYNFDGLAGVVLPFVAGKERGEPCVHPPWFINRSRLVTIARENHNVPVEKDVGAADRLLGASARLAGCPILQLDNWSYPEASYLPGTVIDPKPRSYAARYEVLDRTSWWHFLVRLTVGAFIFHGIKQI